MGGDGDSNGQARLEAVEEEETVRMHLTALKREEVALQASPRTDIYYFTEYLYTL